MTTAYDNNERSLIGGTLCYHSDRHPITLTGFSASGKVLYFRHDDAVREDNNGMSDEQTYIITQDPEAPICKAYRRKDGNYYHGGTRIAIGYRRRYYDFSF